MSRTRLYVPSLAAGPLALRGAAAHYLVRVRRLGAGATLELFDGRGHRAAARIDSVGESLCQLVVEPPEQAPRNALPVTLAVAPPKGERADWLVEKCTELGVERIVWLSTERAVVRPRQEGQRRARWERIAQAAARQAERSDVPILEGPRAWEDLLSEPFAQRLLADRRGEPLARVAADLGPGAVVLVVGPEGGLTAAEVASAEQAGYRRVCIASRVLRVETAAVAAVGCLAAAPAHTESHTGNAAGSLTGSDAGKSMGDPP